MLPEGKMSGRKGEAIYLDDLIDEIKKIIMKTVGKKFSKKKAQEVAEQIAVGAIKYAMVKVSPERNILFNKKDITKHEGDTGPYLQYTYARANSILVKAGIFYTGIIAGCSCADDPTPLDEQNEYCELELNINKETAETTIVLLEE